MKSFQQRLVCPVVVLAVAAVMSVSGHRTSHAANLSLRFEATVADVISHNGGVNLGFTVSAGDNLTATFNLDTSSSGTYDEQTFFVRYNQDQPLTFDLNSVNLTIPSYRLLVRNDSPYGLNYGDGIDDVGPHGPNDDLWIQGPLGNLPANSAIDWTTSVNLVGASSRAITRSCV